MQKLEHEQAITVSNVTMQYPSSTALALNDVSLEIQPGEFMSFLGPSGSGKTTLLSLIAGFVNPSSGTVSIGGNQIDGLKPHRRDLGVVFQNYLLFPHMSVFDNVAYPLRQRKMDKSQIREKVTRALALVRLDPYADRLPKELSGGQQQRVAFARAIVFDPRALLMDEPLGALDKNLRSEMQRELARIHRELGMTFVFVTHDQEEALVLSDRIAVFNDGRIEQIGTPEDLYYRPSSLFVGRFLGDSNVFSGKIDVETSTFISPAGSAYLTREELEKTDANVMIVRPEAISIAPKTDTNTDGFEAAVREIVFTGSNVTVYMEFGDGTPGIAKLTMSEASKLAVGQAVTVSWDQLRQHLIHDDGLTS
ncbi:ABC transporter ATP-binding protein [Arthrobacter sp. 260]|nr:ABC transporter ATP-binding protein [Arthrobacter sp. 260]